VLTRTWAGGVGGMILVAITVNVYHFRASTFLKGSTFVADDEVFRGRVTASWL